MKILQVCKKFPYPPKDGEMIAIFNFTQSFVELGNEVTVLSLNTNKHYYDISKLPTSISDLIQFHTVNINTDIHFIDALSSLFRNQAYNIQRFYSKEFEYKLISLIKNNTYDVILLEGLPLLLYVESIKKNCKTHISYRAHNVEFEIWERLGKNSKNIFKSIYYSILAKQVKLFETEKIRQVDSIIPISYRDKQILENITSKIDYHIAPACINPNYIHINSQNTNYQSIFFLGALDWLPNLEGIEWFINQIFPTILQKLPNTKLYIAGRNIPKSFYIYQNNQIEILGEIENVSDFMNAHQIMIVPLLSGGGMRIKIIEAMLYGKCIISTDIGAEGIEDKNSLTRCSNASIFANETIELLQNKTKQISMGSKAKSVATDTYTAINVSANLLSFYKKTLSIN